MDQFLSLMYWNSLYLEHTLVKPGLRCTSLALVMSTIFLYFNFFSLNLLKMLLKLFKFFLWVAVDKVYSILYIKSLMPDLHLNSLKRQKFPFFSWSINPQVTLNFHNFKQTDVNRTCGLLKLHLLSLKIFKLNIKVLHFS